MSEQDRSSWAGVECAVDAPPPLSRNRPFAASDLPVTGAWREGDKPGDRRFFAFERLFALEGGGLLPRFDVAYETWGTLDSEASNAILVAHALTGDSHAAGPSSDAHPTDGWWNELIGPGLPLDTNRFFIVCANVLGGCQGTTGPSSTDPRTGRPYGASFPVVSIRDSVRTQRRLAEHLGIERWFSIVGGSMGGMQALEWAVMFPDRLQSLVVLASTPAASAQQIAWSAVGRRAIVADPKWREGDYYDAAPGDGPHAGLAVARQIAQIHYRSEPVFEDRFGREPTNSVDDFGLWDRFQVEAYLDHHGNKLVRRFDANTYLLLNKAMDLHDIGRGRRSIEDALARITVPTSVMSINSDGLYPPYQQRHIHEGILRSGAESEFVTIDSPHGHDGFLLEFEQVGAGLEKLFDRL